MLYFMYFIQTKHLLFTFLDCVLLFLCYRYERQTYYRRRAEAEANPKEVLSYIVDGMDQKKCDIPHYRGFADPKVN